MIQSDLLESLACEFPPHGRLDPFPGQGIVEDAPLVGLCQPCEGEGFEFGEIRRGIEVRPHVNAGTGVETEGHYC